MENLTIEEALKIQYKQLENWKRKLKHEYYIVIRDRAVRDNHKAKTGYDIFRGTSIDIYVHNL